MEQLNMSDQDRLQRASDLGCFGKLKIEGEPQYMRISGKDFSMESWVLMGKGTTGITYMILPNGMMYNYDEYKKDPSQRDPNKTLEMKWTCPNLDISSEQKTYLKELETKGWTTVFPNMKNLDDGVWLGFDLVHKRYYDPETGKWLGVSLSPERTAKLSPILYSGFEEPIAYSKYFRDLASTRNGKDIGNVYVYKRNPVKKTFKEEDPQVCRKSIKELILLKRKKKTEDSAYVENLRNIVQNCVNQRDFILRPDIKNDVKELSSIIPSSEDGKFRIQLPQRESLKRLVGRVLREEKEKKTNDLIETKLVESRLKFILEDVKQMVKLSKPQKVKKAFSFLSELNQIKKLDLVSENLTDTFKQIFGKSLDSMVGNVSEPLLNSVFIKVSLPDDVKNQVLTKIKEKSQELIQNMDNCENLAKFLSNEVSEVLAENMVAKNLFNSELVNTAMADALTDESFKERLAEKMKVQVCDLFNKFSTNAQNLVTKLTSQEV